jgi:hypothetical protein
MWLNGHCVESPYYEQPDTTLPGDARCLTDAEPSPIPTGFAAAELSESERSFLQQQGPSWRTDPLLVEEKGIPLFRRAEHNTTVFSRPKNQPHNLTMLRMENLCITEVGMAMNASGEDCSRGEVADGPGGDGLPVCTRFRRAARFAPPLSPDLPFHTAPVFVHRIEYTDG